MGDADWTADDEAIELDDGETVTDWQLAWVDLELFHQWLTMHLEVRRLPYVRWEVSEGRFIQWYRLEHDQELDGRATWVYVMTFRRDYLYVHVAEPGDTFVAWMQRLWKDAVTPEPNPPAAAMVEAGRRAYGDETRRKATLAHYAIETLGQKQAAACDKVTIDRETYRQCKRDGALYGEDEFKRTWGQSIADMWQSEIQ